MWAGVVCVHRLEEELKALEVEAASLQEDAELPMHLKAGGELSGFAVQIKNVAFRYGPDSPVLFRGAELGVDSKSRIVLRSSTLMQGEPPSNGSGGAISSFSAGCLARSCATMRSSLRLPRPSLASMRTARDRWPR